MMHFRRLCPYIVKKKAVWLKTTWWCVTGCVLLSSALVMLMLVYCFQNVSFCWICRNVIISVLALLPLQQQHTKMKSILCINLQSISLKV